MSDHSHHERPFVDGALNSPICLTGTTRPVSGASSAGRETGLGSSLRTRFASPSRIITPSTGTSTLSEAAAKTGMTVPTSSIGAAISCRPRSSVNAAIASRRAMFAAPSRLRLAIFSSRRCTTLVLTAPSSRRSESAVDKVGFLLRKATPIAPSTMVPTQSSRA